MAMNAATAYQNNKIKTASPEELTLLLYDGAIKYCNITIDSIKEGIYDKANENIIKAEKIVSYLRATLDPKYPVTKEFDLIYDYLYRRLVDANIKKDIEIMEEVLQYLREIRDTWKEVMKLGKLKG